MSNDLFDLSLLSLRRDRAARIGPALFLYDRVFGDILDRLGQIRRSFESALLIGVPDPGWPQRLSKVADKVRAIDPGLLFAHAGGGERKAVDALNVEPASFDLGVVIGMLDTANDLPAALLRLRFALRPDSLLIGAISGGDTLPELRAAMRSADAPAGSATPHVHPRIEASALAQLLTAAGFSIPVIDVDRVRASYRSFHDIVRDLRLMGTTNVLTKRSKVPLGRHARAAAEEEFMSRSVDGRTVETFEILHFAAWTPADSS